MEMANLVGLHQEFQILSPENEKIKVMFLKMDTDCNGKIDAKEFKAFVLCLKLKDTEISVLFRSIAKDNTEFITFRMFCKYVEDIVLQESRLQQPFTQADCIDSISQGSEYNTHGLSVESLNAFRAKMRESYDNADGKEIATFSQKRWEEFANLERIGESGQVAMTGAHCVLKDILPGNYILMDLVCFTDLPPVVPKITAVRGAQWETGVPPGTYGKLLFPQDFDGSLATDIATAEYLRYYGCSFAEGNKGEVYLQNMCGILDFNYQEQYLDDYVLPINGGSSLEIHEFGHLQCPLQKHSGFFVLGKLIGSEEIHLTAFQVPVRHTLYIPPMVIHSNDHLRGTWRTMLSDEADLQKVDLVRGTNLKEFNHFKFNPDIE